jgi:pyruvate formate lyase activating enzyme
MGEIKFAGIVDSSTIDYIGRACAVIYLCGCSFRCPWCQNKELVFEERCRLGSTSKLIQAVKDNFLIEAVSVTGGEPLVQEETVNLLAGLKDNTSLLVKLDTNGFCPSRLNRALPFLDFVALDVKAPLNESYGKAVGIEDTKGEIVKNVKESLNLLKDWGGESEARTTVVPGLTDSKEAIAQIAKEINQAGFKYYTIQQFRPMNTLDPAYLKLASPKHSFMLELGKEAKKHLPKTLVRISTKEKGFEEITQAK